MTFGSSVAKLSDHLIEHISFNLKLDFMKKIIHGSALYNIKTLNLQEDSLHLDIEELDIKSIKLNGSDVEWSTTSVGKYCCLVIKGMKNKSNPKLEIIYTTTDKCSATQWLTTEMTRDKKGPFMFSQCQAIHARSLYACQDVPAVKFTYDAEVLAPCGTTVVMGAVKKNVEKIPNSDTCRYTFTQNIPISSYLFAIAAGILSEAKLGPRCYVWAEPSMVSSAAEEFSDTEQMLTKAEEICGPYRWGTYGILVLPPSFPYGGMENPCVTFVTPTIIAGDKSLVSVIAHEIMHSWTGNLVTNQSWDHFWLNEGHTVYLERLLLESLWGHDWRQLDLNLGLQAFKSADEDFGSDSNRTKLVLDLKDLNPDDAYSKIPYEKGSLFLYYLESIVGKDEMLKWIKDYVIKYAGKTLITSEWIEFFKGRLSDPSILKSVDWEAWMHKPGMPPLIPAMDNKPIQKCHDLFDQIKQANPSVKQFAHGYNSLSAAQKEYLLSLMGDELTSLSESTLSSLDSELHFSNSANCEYRYNWSLMCLKNRFSPGIESVFTFLNSQGRMKYVRPIYREMKKWPELKSRMLENFASQKSQMHPITLSMVKVDLSD